MELASVVFFFFNLSVAFSPPPLSSAVQCVQFYSVLSPSAFALPGGFIMLFPDLLIISLTVTAWDQVAQKLLKKHYQKLLEKNKNAFWSDAKICKLYNKSKISKHFCAILRRNQSVNRLSLDPIADRSPFGHLMKFTQRSFLLYSLGLSTAFYRLGLSTAFTD